MTDNNNLIFGLDTFGDIAYDERTGERWSYTQSLKNIVEEGKLADQVGVDVIALGEHHRAEYGISSPDTVLAALATVTENITLGTGVTILSSDDPVRVYERFSTINALSDGRAQIMLGRGAFTESFPLFGYDVRNYEDLFEEKIALFNELLKGNPVSWEGHFTQSLENVQLYPKVEGQLQTRIGVGGSPDSVIRAARYGFPMVLAVIGGNPYRFKQYIDLYKRAATKFGTPIHPVGIHSPGVVADTDEEAREIAWKYVKRTIDHLSEEKGMPAMTRDRFEFEVANGSYYVGSPETVAQKMAHVMSEVGIERFDLVYGGGGQLQKDRFKMIQLYGEKVVPRVKELLKAGVTNE